jgi:hypothetical protein
MEKQYTVVALLLLSELPYLTLAREKLDIARTINNQTSGWRCFATIIFITEKIFVAVLEVVCEELVAREIGSIATHW